jgi:hypothetical protein
MSRRKIMQLSPDQNGRQGIIPPVDVAASRTLPILNEHPIPSGIAHGIGVHPFMTFVVIRASAIGSGPIVWSNFGALLLMHMIVVGPSIAVTVARVTAPISAQGGTRDAS